MTPPSTTETPEADRAAAATRESDKAVAVTAGLGLPAYTVPSAEPAASLPPTGPSAGSGAIGGTSGTSAAGERTRVVGEIATNDGERTQLVRDMSGGDRTQLIRDNADSERTQVVPRNVFGHREQAAENDKNAGRDPHHHPGFPGVLDSAAIDMTMPISMNPVENSGSLTGHILSQGWDQGADSNRYSRARVNVALLLVLLALIGVSLLFLATTGSAFSDWVHGMTNH